MSFLLRVSDPPESQLHRRIGIGVNALGEVLEHGVLRLAACEDMAAVDVDTAVPLAGGIDASGCEAGDQEVYDFAYRLADAGAVLALASLGAGMVGEDVLGRARLGGGLGLGSLGHGASTLHPLRQHES